jgi:hypothetical protein
VKNRPKCSPIPILIKINTERFPFEKVARKFIDILSFKKIPKYTNQQKTPNLVTLFGSQTKMALL